MANPIFRIYPLYMCLSRYLNHSELIAENNCNVISTCECTSVMDVNDSKSDAIKS